MAYRESAISAVSLGQGSLDEVVDYRDYASRIDPMPDQKVGRRVGDCWTECHKLLLVHFLNQFLAIFLILILI